MIERIGISEFGEPQSLDVVCDSCDKEESFTDVYWQEMIDELKSLGWKIKKQKGDWLHFCEDCR